VGDSNCFALRHAVTGTGVLAARARGPRPAHPGKRRGSNVEQGAHTLDSTRQHGSDMNRTSEWGGKDVTPIQTSRAGRRVLRRPAQ
jgi:hypothetical protein